MSQNLSLEFGLVLIACIAGIRRKTVKTGRATRSQQLMQVIHLNKAGLVHCRRKSASSAALHRRETKRLAVVRHPRMLP
jgi:hypothetical protein